MSGPLHHILKLTEKQKQPLMLTLDGGIQHKTTIYPLALLRTLCVAVSGNWADSAFSHPDYDVVDELEKNKMNCQWNQTNGVEPDSTCANPLP